MTHLLILLIYLFHYGRAQTTAPESIPLIVRSPSLTCWGVRLNFDQAITILPINMTCDQSDWGLTVNESLSMRVLVRVDNTTYSFVGEDFGSVHANNTVISPTQTTFAAEVGSMQINLTFLNPIEPEDWVKQSIPFSYMSLTAKSLDGAAHSVQVYSDLNAVWSPSTSWNTTSDEFVTYHRVGLETHIPNNQTLYYAMKNSASDGVTYKRAEDTVPQELFRQNGTLDDQINTPSPPTNNSVTAFAISRDLGNIQATKDPIVWAIGYITDPVINYTDPSGVSQQRSLYYKTQYLDDDDSLILDFLNDFANASSRAQQLDLKILQDAAPISGLLGDLVSYAAPQVYGSTHLTIAIDAYGYFNKSNAMAFIKNNGGLGDWQVGQVQAVPGRVNAVETLYSAFPAFMYIDPKLGGLFLEPLLRLQEFSEYSIPYAAPDLGADYPNVTISNSTHGQGVEQSGNMLIMTYAYARASGDDSLISSHYSLLTSWADYLSNATLSIHDQSSADGLTTDNQTNLAIKGIIAIKAMSKMSSILNRSVDVDKYSSTAANLYAQWRSNAVTGDGHLIAAYGQEESWTLGYNLFADVWLGTNVVESSVYDGQSIFLDHLLLTSNFSDQFGKHWNFSNYGIPVDNFGSESTSAPVSCWNLFVAAMTPDQDLRANILTSIYRREIQGGSRLYIPTFAPSILDGEQVEPSAAQGAMYASLALRAPVNLTIPNPTTTPTGTSSVSKSHTDIVVGGVIGGVAALLAIGTISLAVGYRRRQRHKRTSPSVESSSFRDATDQGTQVTVTPFSLPGLAPNEAAPVVAGLVHRPSSPEDPSLPLRQEAPFPVGLSGKELARLRSNGLRSQAVDGRPPSPPSNATDGSDAFEGAGTVTTGPLASGAQRLRLESNFSRDEIQQLLVERSESPPSYASRPWASNM